MKHRPVRTALLALTVTLFAAAAQAAPNVVAPAEGTAAAKKASADKVRCMRHKEIGSNRIKKICMPASDWNRLTAEERDAVIRSDRGAAILED